MDYMDPKQRRRHGIMVFVGYGLIGVAILLVTTILVYVAYGFGYKNGEVIQNGLVFVSSVPRPTEVYIDGVRYKDNTNTRITLPAGNYNFELKRAGYRSWQRPITVSGGSVTHYDYPFLFPIDLQTTNLRDFPTPPSLASQSPDRRWLVLQPDVAAPTFDVYDLKDPTKAPVTIALPAGVATAAAQTQQYELVEWSNDNTHLLIKHTYDGTAEYLIVNRDKPAESLNVNRALSLPEPASDIRLIDKKYDRYYIFDAAKQTLMTASLAAPQPVAYLEHVLAYRSYSDDTVLYAASDSDAPDKAVIRLKQGDAAYRIRELPLSTTYLLDLTKYSGDMYVLVTAANQDRAYIYKNPVAQLDNKDVAAAVPVQILRVKTPTYASFSTSAQYVMVENGTNFGVYDAENKQDYVYTVPTPLDNPQTHATWMDGNRLLFASAGKTVVFDYDGRNQQTLTAASPEYVPFFAPNYKVMYTLAPGATDASHRLLTSTPLLTKADQ